MGLEDVEDTSINHVSWDFVTFPGQAWKNALGEDLLSYAEGSMDWDKVISNAKELWASEKAAE